MADGLHIHCVIIITVTVTRTDVEKSITNTGRKVGLGHEMAYVPFEWSESGKETDANLDQMEKTPRYRTR